MPHPYSLRIRPYPMVSTRPRKRQIPPPQLDQAANLQTTKTFRARQVPPVRRRLMFETDPNRDGTLGCDANLLHLVERMELSSDTEQERAEQRQARGTMYEQWRNMLTTVRVLGGGTGNSFVTSTEPIEQQFGRRSEPSNAQMTSNKTEQRLVVVVVVAVVIVVVVVVVVLVVMVGEEERVLCKLIIIKSIHPLSLSHTDTRQGRLLRWLRKKMLASRSR